MTYSLVIASVLILAVLIRIVKVVAKVHRTLFVGVTKISQFSMVGDLKHKEIILC